MQSMVHRSEVVSIFAWEPLSSMDNSQWQIKNPRSANVLLRHEEQLIIQPYPTVSSGECFARQRVLYFCSAASYQALDTVLDSLRAVLFLTLWSFYLGVWFTILAHFNMHTLHKPAAHRAAWIL